MRVFNNRTHSHTHRENKTNCQFIIKLQLNRNEEEKKTNKRELI